MTRIAHRLATVTALVALLALFSIRPAAAQQFLRDAETEALFADISAPLVEAAGMRPDNVEFVLINDDSINAFVAGGQRVYIHSGLIASSDHVGQLQAVIAHELGHVAGGHIIRLQSGVNDASTISIASLLLGGLAMAAGGGEAGMGAMLLGQQVARTRFLAFSRTQETSADIAGASYLSAAGISGRGSIEFFKKLQNQEFRYAIPQDNSYQRTHPLSGERVSYLQNIYENDPAWRRANDPALEARFQRVKAKLIGYLDPARALRDYPHARDDAAARTARAYAYHQGAYPEQALAEVEALVAAHPDDPYLLELKGQILLESGHPAAALAPLRRALELAPDEPLIATALGHALVATEDESRFDEAKTVLRRAVLQDRYNPFAWYQLGVIYEREGDTPRAALASAERFHMLGQHKLALASARMAMNGIGQGPDFIRAQDIAMVSEHELRKAGEEIR
ncbi:M48 family metalloprotease [Sphingomicrobium astaxanthinifaciens]|uniref:M48 family metalloprotease n=1 Tax=Sphingomicrobium astaxanthinifaciens TaxID=1227949 RepID=UPI001FCBC4AE|nr:M48 family metalloprotease [Sphingomicrobium astaxanthinifaciens]MCJ7421758.1 M48 family metalloprotease [Sphingomicrobium astaxanthinifaciens]